MLVEKFLTTHGTLFSEFQLSSENFLDFMEVANHVDIKRTDYNDFIQGFG